MLKEFQDLIVESRRLKKGQFAERIIALQKRANFELMSITYDILHKPARVRTKGSNQIQSDGLVWEDALKQACMNGENSIDMVLDIDYEFFLKSAFTPPDKVNILTGVYSIYDSATKKYVEFPDAPNLVESLRTKLDVGFLLSCTESKFNKVAELHIEVPLPEKN